MLSNDFPGYQMVDHWFRRLIRRIRFRSIHDLGLNARRNVRAARSRPLLLQCRQPARQGRGARQRGYDAYKPISARKRHIATDTDGLRLAVNLAPAASCWRRASMHRGGLCTSSWPGWTGSPDRRRRLRHGARGRGTRGIRHLDRYSPRYRNEWCRGGRSLVFRTLRTRANPALVRPCLHAGRTRRAGGDA